jgi:hypothetical protein
MTTIFGVIVVILIVLVVVLALRWKGDVRATVRTLGVTVSLEATDKRRRARRMTLLR